MRGTRNRGPGEKNNSGQPQLANGQVGSTKPGTHCNICGELIGDSYPGADVYHMSCLMEATEYLRK